MSDIPLETVPRCVLRGSLDPTTGIFYKTPEHTRIRTAQACDKCRVRKAKCSGDHPVCERCHIRGLICHYAPERRIRQTKVEHDALTVPDGSTSRPGAVLPSSDALQPCRPRTKSGGTSTSRAPSDRLGSEGSGGNGNGNGQRTGGTAPRARPRRATIASAAATSSPDEGVGQSEPSFLQQVLDLRRGGPDRPVKGHDGPVSGLRRVGVTHEALETTESTVCGGDGKVTLEGDLDVDTPRIEENALALYLDPYTGGLPALLESVLTPKATGVEVTLSDHDPACIHPDLTGAEYPGGVDGAQHPMLFHHPLRFHWSGPGPGSCFDMSLADMGMIPNDGRPSFCSASDVESPGWTPSTSPSASPDLTRSVGLPTTPTNSHPNSPFTLASLSPHLGPFHVVSDPSAYPLFESEVKTMDMGHHYRGGSAMLTEINDGAHALEGSLGL
ncbi:hypothetical protein J3R82DRAFT_2003 [Butyriboletus roseoflavus]|nr:hypothetical protein J3R82DRAFT_2003 [Butyriboletus roseoflavus]